MFLADTAESEKMVLADGNLQYYPQLFSDRQAAWLEELYHSVPWQQEWLTMFGRRVQSPRLIAWYGDRGASYSYSGNTHSPLQWTSLLRTIKAAIADCCNWRFNSALLNLYRDGNDAMGWHSDNEPELGEQPRIASVSLGEMRRFELKHRKHPQRRQRMELAGGSLLLMGGDLQRHWLHRVPRQPNRPAKRINITFRLVNTLH